MSEALRTEDAMSSRLGESEFGETEFGAMSEGSELHGGYSDLEQGPPPRRRLDDMEGDVAGRDLHLHVDGTRLNAFERNRLDPRDHGSPPASRAWVCIECA